MRLVTSKSKMVRIITSCFAYFLPRKLIDIQVVVVGHTGCGGIKAAYDEVHHHSHVEGDPKFLRSVSITIC